MQTKPFRILLLDDEPTVSFALKLLLSSMGYAVLEYNLPKLALSDIAAGLHVDLLITDLRMPEINGMQVLIKVKESKPDLDVVMISGHANPAEIEQAHKLGVLKFLSKPFSPHEVKAIVEELILAQQSRAA